MISSLVPSSRLPVGSSASSTRGSLTSARAIATRCCWPPDSSDGQVPQPVAEADRGQRRLGPRPPFAAGKPERHQRRLHVLGRAERRDQVEGLEDEPDRSGPHLPGQPGFRSRPGLAVELERARGRTVQAAQDLQQGGLAVAGRALHGEPLTVADDQVQVAQGGDLGPPLR